MMRGKRYWNKNEKDVMVKLGLEPVFASGAGMKKEDGQNEVAIAQLKSTEKESISIKLLDVELLLYNASVAHKVPVFVLQFMRGPLLLCARPEDFSTLSEYLSLPESKLEEMLEKAENNTKNICTIKSDRVIIRPRIKTSTNREKVREELRAEREAKYKSGKGNKR